MPKADDTANKPSGEAAPRPAKAAPVEAPPNPTLRQHAKKMGLRAGAFGAVCFALEKEPDSREVTFDEFKQKADSVTRSRAKKEVDRKAAAEREAERLERNRPIRTEASK